MLIIFLETQLVIQMSINRFTAYRNSDEFSNLDLHMRSRTAPLRNRRDLRIEHQSTTTEDKPSTEIAAIESDGQRNRRDAPECVSNYNAERHLLIGCSQPNIIEVRPQCNQEDEGMCTPEFVTPPYSMHWIHLHFFFHFFLCQYTIAMELGLKILPHSRWRYTLVHNTVCALLTNHWSAQQLDYMLAIRVSGHTCCQQVIIIW